MSGEQAERYKTQGNQALQAGQHEEAVRLYTLAVREDPFCEVYFSNRSAAFVALKQFKEALDDADEVVRLKPAWVKGHTRRGAALSGMKKHEEARKAYAKACDLEPANAQVRQQMEAEAKAAAAVLEKSKDWENDLWSDDEDEGGGAGAGTGGDGGGGRGAAGSSTGGAAGAKRDSAEDGAAEQPRKKRRASGKLMAKLGQSLADASRDTLRICLQQLCSADEHLAEKTLQMLEGLNENSSNGEDDDNDDDDDDGEGGGARGSGGNGGGRRPGQWPKPPAPGPGGSRKMAEGDAEDSD